MVATSRWAKPAARVAAATAISENGMPGRTLAPTSITAATPRASASAAGCGWRAKSATARAATTTTFSASPFVTPRAAGTCWSPITPAMPRVKPSTTGAGT